MPDPYEYHSFEEAIKAIEEGVADAVGDNPDVNSEDAAHDIAINFLPLMEDNTRHQVARCYLGWDPIEDVDLYARHRIPLIDRS